MMTPRFLIAGLVAAGACLTGCSKEAEHDDAAEHAAGEHEHAPTPGHDAAGHDDGSADHDAAGHDEGGNEGAGHDDAGHDEGDGEHGDSKQAKAGVFAALITSALREGDTKTVVSHMKGENLPEGWQELMVPMLNGLKGYELAGTIRPRSDFSNADLNWPEETPESLKEVEDILYVHYGNDNTSGSRSFPLVYRDGEWWILLGQ